MEYTKKLAITFILVRLNITRIEVVLYLIPWEAVTIHTPYGRKDIKNTPTVSSTVVTPSHLSVSPCREAALLATATLITEYHVYQVGKLGERIL